MYNRKAMSVSLCGFFMRLKKTKLDDNGCLKLFFFTSCNKWTLMPNFENLEQSRIYSCLKKSPSRGLRSILPMIEHLLCVRRYAKYFTRTVFNSHGKPTR